MPKWKGGKNSPSLSYPVSNFFFHLSNITKFYFLCLKNIPQNSYQSAIFLQNHIIHLRNFMLLALTPFPCTQSLDEMRFESTTLLQMSEASSKRMKKRVIENIHAIFGFKCLNQSQNMLSLVYLFMEKQFLLSLMTWIRNVIVLSLVMTSMFDPHMFVCLLSSQRRKMGIIFF